MPTFKRGTVKAVFSIFEIFVYVYASVYPCNEMDHSSLLVTENIPENAYSCQLKLVASALIMVEEIANE